MICVLYRVPRDLRRLGWERRWLAELLCDLLTAVGPQGLDFAKASIDRATLRNLVCLEARRLRHLLKKKAKEMGTRSKST